MVYDFSGSSVSVSQVPLVFNTAGSSKNLITVGFSMERQMIYTDERSSLGIDWVSHCMMHCMDHNCYIFLDRLSFKGLFGIYLPHLKLKNLGRSQGKYSRKVSDWKN